MNPPFDLAVYKEALLFLVTAGVVAPLFFRIHVSPVLGYLLAGVALGPFGLGRLAERTPWLEALALTDVASIDRLAAFGVVVLLFTIGLELSFERLKRMRRLVFELGLAQVVVCAVALGRRRLRARAQPGRRVDDRRGAVALLHRDRHSGAGRGEAARRGGRAVQLRRAAVSGSRGRAAAGSHDDARPPGASRASPPASP